MSEERVISWRQNITHGAVYLIFGHIFTFVTVLQILIITPADNKGCALIIQAAYHSLRY